MTIRTQLIKLAHENPELREDLLPILKQAGTFRYEGQGTLDMAYAVSDVLSAIQRQTDFPRSARSQLMKAKSEARKLDEAIAKAAGTPKTGKLKQFHPGSVPRGMEDGPERDQYLDKMVEGVVLDALKEAGRCLASVEDIGLFLDPETDNQFMPKAKSVHDAVKNLEHTMKLLKSIVRFRRRP